jgi:hypothetical protein
MWYFIGKKSPNTNYFFEPFMNKQFVLLALATMSLNSGAAPLSIANASPGQASNLQALSQAKKPEIDVNKISIGPFRLGMTTAQIEKTLGKPIKISSVNNCKMDTVINYPKLELGMSNGRLHFISSRSKLYATKEGVRVGDTLSKARQIYGKFKSNGGNESFFNTSRGGGVSFNVDEQEIIFSIVVMESC